MEALKFVPWGVRGSFPAAARDFLAYGGNTSCYSVQLGSSLVVFDAGSGLAALGDRLRQRTDINDMHILISHAHMDHVMGLFPFLSMFGRDRAIHLYGGDALKSLEALVDAPYWPCSLRQSGACLHRIEPGKPFRLAAEDAAVRFTAMAGTHPGGCLWYRLDRGGRSIVYLLDCETDPARRPEMLRFARGADLLVWDASWPPGQEKPGWGHSTWAQGADFGREAGAKRVLMTHYARELDDRALERLEHDAVQAWDACIFAREGTGIEL